MGQVYIHDNTTKFPITMIGKYASICQGTTSSDKYKIGLNCLRAGHGRTFEFPDVYMTLDGYSARVIREWYTHIGGSPTRLQESTRYVDYSVGFDYILPNTNPEAEKIYSDCMDNIADSISQLMNLGMAKEDAQLLLPLGMTTKIVCKHNLRNLMDMSHQRLCNRAYWEFRELFNDVCEALKDYSDEWKYIVENYFVPKCEITGYCTEKKSCGRKPKKI